MPALDPLDPQDPSDRSPDVDYHRQTTHPDGRRSSTKLALRRTRAIVVGVVLALGSVGVIGANAGSDDKSDPRFSSCAEAKQHGYGSYRRDEDPEYDWYRDADNDGVVCDA
jgi:hypothetical protein